MNQGGYMNIYHFSKMVNTTDKEPTLEFRLLNSDNCIKLTFPSWKNKELQNILRFVEYINVTNDFNPFKIRRVINDPRSTYHMYYVEMNSDKTRTIPEEICNYLIDNNLAENRDPKQMTLRWIDKTNHISSEDIYDNQYDGGDHFYFNDFYSLTSIIKDQSDGVKELLGGLTYCKCGCVLHVRLSDLGYTTLHCLNPYCPVKLPFVLSDIAKNLDIVGLGSVVFETTIWRIFCENIKKFGKPHVRLMDVLNEDFFLQYNDITGEKMNLLWDKICNYKAPLNELIKFSELPYIGEIASETYTPHIFEHEPKTFIDFWKSIKGRKVKNARVAFIMWLYYHDIKHLLTITKAKLRDAETVLNIVITGGVVFKKPDGTVIKYKNKKNYIEDMNELLRMNNLDEDFRFVLKNSLSSRCFCLINDNEMTGHKNSYAQELGIPIIKSNQIFYLLKEVYYE